MKEETKVENISQFKASHFIQNGGTGLLKLYNSSISKVLQSIKDEKQDSLKSRKTQKWTLEKQKLFVDEVGKKLGIVDKHHFHLWYKVKRNDFAKLGGGGLIMGQYSSSIYRMLSKIYPDFDWLPWEFENMPRELSKDPLVLRKAIRYIENELNIKNLSNWNSIPLETLRVMKAFKVIRNNGVSENRLSRVRF